MENFKIKRFLTFLPWLIVIVLLGAFAVYGIHNPPNRNHFVSQSIKTDLVSDIRVHLLEAIEAEKNAVLAITDKDSEIFAAKARKAVDELESKRKSIDAIIRQDDIQAEIDLVNEFNECWLQFEKLDGILLNLAIQNTNIKARQISTTQANPELKTLEDSLNRIIESSRSITMVAPAYRALIAGNKIYVLLKLHIETAGDMEMDKLEQDIFNFDDSARKAFSTLNGESVLKNNPDLKNAVSAYEKLWQVAQEIIRLSRLNTNIKSVELSLGEKRLISSKCQEILTALQKAVHTQESYTLPRFKRSG